MSQKRAREEYHDPDYPSPAAAEAAGSEEPASKRASMLLLSSGNNNNNCGNATPPSAAVGGAGKSAAQQADIVCQIVLREFAHELAEREQELNRIEHRLQLAKRLLKRVRYAVVYNFYTNKKLVYTENELRNELTVLSAGGEETVVSTTEAGHSAAGSYAAGDQLDAPSPAAPPQLAVHPSLKKLLGTDTIDYNEILRIRPARQAAVDAKTSIAEKLRTKKDERRLRMAAAPPALHDTTTAAAAPKVPRYISPIKSPSATPIRALNSARGLLRTAKPTLLAVGNTSKYIGADEGVGPDAASCGGVTHKWLMYVKVKDGDELDIGKLVAKVRFFLHPSYKPNDVVDVSRPPFQIARRGWGEFPVRVQVFFHEEMQQKPVQMYHQLKLDKRLTGLQTMGSETVVEVLANMPAQPTLPQPQAVRHKRSPVKRLQLAPPAPTALPTMPPPMPPPPPAAAQLDLQLDIKIVSILPDDIQLEETVLSSEPCWDPDGLIKSVQISAAEQHSLMAMAEESKRFAGDLSILASPPMAPRRMLSLPEGSSLANSGAERVSAMQQKILANGLSPNAGAKPVTPPPTPVNMATVDVAAMVPTSRVVPLAVALPNRVPAIVQPPKPAAAKVLAPNAPITQIQTLPTPSKLSQLPRLPQTLMRQASAPTASTIKSEHTSNQTSSTPSVATLVAPKSLVTIPASTTSTSQVPAPTVPSVAAAVAVPAAASASVAPAKPAAPLRRFVRCLDNQGKVIMVELQADPNNPKNLRMVRNNPQTGKPSVLTPAPPPPKFVLSSKLATGTQLATPPAVSSAPTALPNVPTTTQIPIASTSATAAGPRIYVLPKGQSPQSMLQQIKLKAAAAAATPKPSIAAGPQQPASAAQPVRLLPNNGATAAPAANIAGLPSTKKVIMRNGQMFIIDTAQFVQRAVPTTNATASTSIAATTSSTSTPPAAPPVLAARVAAPPAVARPKQQSLLKPQISLLKPQISRLPAHSSLTAPSTSAASAAPATATTTTPLRPPQHVPLRMTPATVLRPPVATGPLKFAIKLPVNSLSAGVRTTTLQPLVRRSSLIRPASGVAPAAAGSVQMRLVMTTAPNGQPTAMRPPSQLLKQPSTTNPQQQRMRSSPAPLASSGAVGSMRPPLRAIVLPPEKSLFNSPAAAAAAAAQRLRTAVPATPGSAAAGAGTVTHRPTDFRRQLEQRLRSRAPHLTQRAAIRYLLHTVPQVHRMAASSRDFQQAFSFVATSAEQYERLVWPLQRCSEWRRAQCVAQLLQRVWQQLLQPQPQQPQKLAGNEPPGGQQRRWTTKEIALFGRHYGFSLPVRPIGPADSSGSGSTSTTTTSATEAASVETALSTLIREEIRRTDPALEATLTGDDRLSGWLDALEARINRRKRARGGGVGAEEIIDVDTWDEEKSKPETIEAAAGGGVGRSRSGRTGKRERRPRGIFPLPEGMRREAGWVAEVCRKARINIQPEEIVDDILHPSAQLVMVTALHQFASDLLHRAYASKSDEDRQSSQPADHVVSGDNLRKTIASIAQFDFLTNRDLGSKSSADQQPTAAASSSTIKRELQ